MKGVILAGGLGTRLYPVTLEIPKPLLPVKRQPILNHLLAFFARHGVDEPIVLIGKSHAEEYAWWRRRYGEMLPRTLRLVEEPEPLGTFGGLRCVSDELREPFVLSNGDELKDFDLGAFIKFHSANQGRPVGTIALTAVQNPSEYGVPIMEGDKIVEFLEKPEKPPGNFVSAGFYILEPDVFEYADFSKGFLMIERDIFPKLAAARRLAGYRIPKGRWYDCGTFSRWERAIREW